MKEPIKLTFTPKRLREIVFAGLAAEGFHFEGDFGNVIAVEETEARQGREQLMTPVFLVTIEHGS